MAKQETFFNESNIDLDELIQLAKLFLPHAQETMGFEQIPAVTFMSDEENSLNPLGKTAYYDPAEMTITVFVDSRHPKDILRSMSHELVHHAQNGRGMFDEIEAIEDGYAQSDDHLREMEREAYELGNMCFRDWEDEYKQRQEWHLVESARAKLQQEGFGDMMRRAGGAVKGAAMKVPGAEKAVRGAQRAGQAVRGAADRADAMVGRQTTFKQESPEDFEARMKAASKQTVFSPGRGLHVTDDSGKSTHRFAKDREGNQRVFGRDPHAEKQPHYQGDSPYNEAMPGSKGTTSDWHEWIYLHKENKETLDKAFYTMLYSDALTIDQKMVVYENFARAYPFEETPEVTPAEVESEEGAEIDPEGGEAELNRLGYGLEDDEDDIWDVSNLVTPTAPVAAVDAPGAPAELSAAAPGARIAPQPTFAQSERPPFPTLSPGAERLPRDARRANQRWYKKKGIEPDTNLVEETLSFSEELRIRSIVNESLKIVAENKRKQKNKANISKKAKVLYEQVTEDSKKLTNKEIINLARLSGATISENALYKPDSPNLFERDEKLLSEHVSWDAGIHSHGGSYFPGAPWADDDIDASSKTAAEWTTPMDWELETPEDYLELATFDADSPGASIRPWSPEMRYTPPTVTRRDPESGEGTSPYEVQDPEQGWFAENIGEWQQQTFGEAFLDNEDQRREAYGLEQDMQSLIDGGANDSTIDKWISDQSTGDVQDFLTHRRYGVIPTGGYDPSWAYAGIDDLSGPKVGTSDEPSSGLPDFSQAAPYSPWEDMLDSPIADPIDYMAGRTDPKNRDAEHFTRVEDMEGYNEAIDAWIDPMHPDYVANSRYRGAGLQPSYVSFHQRRLQSGYGSQEAALQGAVERGLDYHDFDPEGCRRSADFTKLDNCILKDTEYFYNEYAVAGETEAQGRARAQRMLVEYELDRDHFAAKVSVGRMSAAEQALLQSHIQKQEFIRDSINWRRYADQDWVWADREGGILTTRDLYDELLESVMDSGEYQGSARSRVQQLLQDPNRRREFGANVSSLCEENQARCAEGALTPEAVYRLPVGAAGASNGDSFLRGKGYYKAHTLSSLTRANWTMHVQSYERAMQQDSPGYKSGMQILDPNFVDRGGDSLWKNAFREASEDESSFAPAGDIPFWMRGTEEMAPMGQRQVGFLYGGDDWTTGFAPDGWHIGTGGDTTNGGVRGHAVQRGADLPGTETNPEYGPDGQIIGYNGGTQGYGEVYPDVWGDGSNHIIGPAEGLYSRYGVGGAGAGVELSDEQLSARRSDMQGGRPLDGIMFNTDLAGSQYPWAMHSMQTSLADWMQPGEIDRAKIVDESMGFDQAEMPYLYVGGTDAVFHTYDAQSYASADDRGGRIEAYTPIGGRQIKSVSDYIQYITEVDSTALWSLAATSRDEAHERISQRMTEDPGGALRRNTYAFGTSHTRFDPDTGNVTGTDWETLDDEQLARFSTRIDTQWTEAADIPEWQASIDEASQEIFGSNYSELQPSQRRDVIDTLRINYVSNDERVQDMAQASQRWFNAMCVDQGVQPGACNVQDVIASIGAMSLGASEPELYVSTIPEDSSYDARDSLFFGSSDVDAQDRIDLYTGVAASPQARDGVPSEWLTELHRLATSSDPQDRALRNKIEHVMRHDTTLSGHGSANPLGAEYAAYAEAKVAEDDPSGLLGATQQLTINNPEYAEQLDDLDRVLITAVQKELMANAAYSQLRADSKYLEWERLTRDADSGRHDEWTRRERLYTEHVRDLETQACNMNNNSGCVQHTYTALDANGTEQSVTGWRPFSVQRDLLGSGFEQVLAAHGDRSHYFNGNTSAVKEYLATAYELYGSVAAGSLDMMMSSDIKSAAGLAEGYMPGGVQLFDDIEATGGESIPYSRYYSTVSSAAYPAPGVQDDLLLAPYYDALSTLDPNGPRTFVIHDTGWQEGEHRLWSAPTNTEEADAEDVDAEGEYSVAAAQTFKGSLLEMAQTQASSPDHKEGYLSWLVGQGDIVENLGLNPTFYGYTEAVLGESPGASAGNQRQLGIPGTTLEDRVAQLVSDGVLSEERGEELVRYRSSGPGSRGGWTHRDYKGVGDTRIRPSFVLTGSEYMKAVRVYGDPTYTAQIDPDGPDGYRPPVVTWALKSENPSVFGEVSENGISPSEITAQDMQAGGVYFSQDQWINLMRARTAINGLFLNRDQDGQFLWNAFASDPTTQGTLARFHPRLYQQQMLKERGSMPLCNNLPSYAPPNSVCSDGASEDIMQMLDARDASQAPSVQPIDTLDVTTQEFGETPQNIVASPDSSAEIPGTSQEDIIPSLVALNPEGGRTRESQRARNAKWYARKPDGTYISIGIREGGSRLAALQHLIDRTTFNSNSWLIQSVADQSGRSASDLITTVEGDLQLTDLGRSALQEYLQSTRDELIQTADSTLQEQKIKKFIYDNMELIKERVYNKLDTTQVPNNTELVKNIVKNQIIKLLQE